MKVSLLKRKIVSLVQSIALICLNLPLTSCAHVGKYESYKALSSADLANESKKYEESVKKPDRNYALWNNQLGSLYLAQGDYEKAQGAFLKSYYLMNDISAFKNLESRAVSLTGSEDTKAYKGDPYEKALNAFYVGLLLYNQGDFENAMAAFKNGILADSDSKEEKYKSDFIILYLLAARVAKKLGQEDLARNFYKEPEMTSMDPKDITAQEIVNLNNNTLLVLELGRGPYKYRSGKYGEMAKINDGDSTQYDPQIIVDDNGASASRVYSDTDVYIQASTRGGRKMDGILKGKAQFKDSAAQTSHAMLDAANTTINNANQKRAMNPYADTTGDSVAAGLLLLFAAGSAAASGITNPKADDRHWALLPAHIYVFPLSLSSGKHKIVLGFTESYYSTGTNSEFEVDIVDDKDNVIFKRMLKDPPFVPQNASLMDYGKGVSTTNSNLLENVVSLNEKDVLSTSKITSETINELRSKDQLKINIGVFTYESHPVPPHKNIIKKLGNDISEFYNFKFKFKQQSIAKYFNHYGKYLLMALLILILLILLR